MVQLAKPYNDITAFCNLEGMPRWLFIALGRKGWDARGGATTEVAMRLAY